MMLLWGQRYLAQRYSAPRRKLSLLRSASIRCCRSTIALCPPSDHPASHAIVAASTVPAPRDQQASCDRRRDGAQEGFKRYPIGYFHIDIAEVRRQVERMNRTLKEATVRRYHYDSHHQLRQHIQTFLDAYNFAKRLKTLNGLTPFESVCKAWTKEPNRFKYDPVQLTSGLHT